MHALRKLDFKTGLNEEEEENYDRMDAHTNQDVDTENHMVMHKGRDYPG